MLSRLKIEGFDVKALRAFRVLRPLRLVSGVPSKYKKIKDAVSNVYGTICTSVMNVLSNILVFVDKIK